MVRKVQWGNLRQDWEGQLTYGDRKKQDWYFTSKAVVAMANIASTAPSVCCLGLGYQYVCPVRCAAVLATEEFLDGRLGRSSAEDVGEAQQGLVVLSFESFKFSACSPTIKTITLTFRCSKLVACWYGCRFLRRKKKALNSELTML